MGILSLFFGASQKTKSQKELEEKLSELFANGELFLNKEKSVVQFNEDSYHKMIMNYVRKERELSSKKEIRTTSSNEEQSKKTHAITPG